MERGPEVLGYLAAAGGCAAGFTRLCICNDNGEHDGWVWPSSHKPPPPVPEPCWETKSQGIHIIYLEECPKPVSVKPLSSPASPNPTAASLLATERGWQPMSQTAKPSRLPRPAYSSITHAMQDHLFQAQAMLCQDGLQRLLQTLGGFSGDPYHTLQVSQLQPVRDPRAAAWWTPRGPLFPKQARRGPELNAEGGTVWGWGFSLVGRVPSSMVRSEIWAQ